MGYSIEVSKDDCYPNTTCLINKFGIKDDKKLSEIEHIVRKVLKDIDFSTQEDTIK